MWLDPNKVQLCPTTFRVLQNICWLICTIFSRGTTSLTCYKYCSQAFGDQRGVLIYYLMVFGATEKLAQRRATYPQHSLPAVPNSSNLEVLTGQLANTIFLLSRAYSNIVVQESHPY